jgi:hypothetical protein
MTTEYVLVEGDNLQEVARDLLEQAASPDQVHWSPRPDVYGGGVFVLADESIAQRTVERRRARRAEEAARIEAAQKAADKRDSDPAVAEGLATPAEAGFAANAGTDPGSAGEAERIREATSSDQDAAAQEDEDDDEDEADDDGVPAERPLTTAQKRAAAKAAKEKAAADAAAEEKTE